MVTEGKSSDIKNLAKEYDLAGIVDTPPDEAIRLIKNYHFIVCSDLYRSLELAKAIGAVTVNSSDSLFREISLPSFDEGYIKLPLQVWAGILRVLWFVGFSKHTESLAVSRRRAKLASQKLFKFAEKHPVCFGLTF
ncbi:MAG: hypothetical protein KAH20_04795 [Methylococcales bacterium]|nr:hypothetical protein [Methylococcales bacterium]